MEELNDREQVRELYARYALVLDAGEGEEYVRCFAPQGSFESPMMGHQKGREAIRKMVRSLDARLPGARQRHDFTNISFSLEDDRGVGRCSLTYYVIRAGVAELKLLGDFEDRLCKLDGQWYFESRKLSFLTKTETL